jgi:hypothetical protein
MLATGTRRSATHRGSHGGLPRLCLPLPERPASLPGTINEPTSLALRSYWSRTNLIAGGCVTGECGQEQ